jgi:thiol-disulfide isomerase/thioredoxin
MRAKEHPPMHAGAKGLFRLVLAAALVIAARPVFSADTSPPATVKEATVQVHESMSMDSDVSKVLKKGDKVVVGLEMQIGGADWCEVSEPGKRERLGYVPCASLDRPAPPPAVRAAEAAAYSTGVQVLMGKASPTGAPASKAATARRAPPSRSADRRFISGDVEAPDFTLTGLDGNTYSLHDLRGHYVLLDFWATWCGPCRMEMPRLDRLQKEYAGRGLEIVGVNAGESPDRVRRFIQQNGYSYTILLDPQDQASRLYDAEYIPTLVVVDPNGDVRFYDSGAYSERALRAVLARVGVR